MIGLLAGGDIALGYEIDDLLSGRLIDIPHKDLKGRCKELFLMIPWAPPILENPASSVKITASALHLPFRQSYHNPDSHPLEPF